MTTEPWQQRFTARQKVTVRVGKKVLSGEIVRALPEQGRFYLVRIDGVAKLSPTPEDEIMPA